MNGILKKLIMIGLISLIRRLIMVSVDFSYKSVSGEWKSATKNFNDEEKAIRFIYKCQRDPKLAFMSFGADDYETTQYIMWRTGM